MTNSAHFSKSISDRFHRHVQLSRRCSWREGLWPWSLLDYPQNRGNAGPGEEVLRLLGREKGITVGWRGKVYSGDYHGILGCCTQVESSLSSCAVTAVLVPSIHQSIQPALQTPSTLQNALPWGMLRLSMTCAVIFDLSRLLSSIPLRFPPSAIIQWPRTLLSAGSSKDGRGEDRANWQDKLLARNPPRSGFPCTKLLSSQTPPEMNPFSGGSQGRRIPLQGPEVIGKDGDAALNSPTSRQASKGKPKGWRIGRDLQTHPGSALIQQRFFGPFSFPKRLSHNITALGVRNLLVTTRFHWITFSSFALNFVLLDLSFLPLRLMCRRQLYPISLPFW